MKNGERVSEKPIHGDQETIIFPWEDLWTGESEEADLAILLDEGSVVNENDVEFSWDRQTMDLQPVNITRCGPEHDWSSYHEKCVEINEDIDTEKIEQQTKWTVETRQNTIHTLENIEATSSDDQHDLLINTGYSGGYCGEVYFKSNELEPGTIDFNFHMKEIESDGPRDGQGPQTTLVKINDITVFEEDIEVGNQTSFEHVIESGETVRVGLKDTDWGCDQFYRRTHLEATVTEEQ
ncbi:MAG: hypothetical protein ACLFTA_01155 [Candidatus Nanohaloarchaea archaeon]